MDGHTALRGSVRALTPINALVQPEDVAQAAAFLCAPDNRQMTGPVSLQDGGLSLLGPQI